MKDYLRELVRAAPDAIQARNSTREYLQAHILGSLQRMGAMIPLAFHGGTALRFLYGSARYSEDLDFALERPRAGYDFRGYLRAMQADLSAEGYAAELRLSDQKTVHSAFIRFPGLLYELGLSPHRDQVFSVKVEVDTRPPAGAGLVTTVVRRHVTLQLQHHDRPSLLAGKLHAILSRAYLKGRDLYDLLWFLSDPTWPPPNLVLLNNALTQTHWPGKALSGDAWRTAVRRHLRGVDWDRAVADVRPFLPSDTAPSILTRENIMRVLA